MSWRIGAVLLVALPAVACSVRLGSGDDVTEEEGLEPGQAGGEDPNNPTPQAACQRASDEVKLDVGAGTDSFAFLWDEDHYLVAYTDKAVGAGDITTVILGPDGSPRGAPTSIEATPAVSDLPNLLRTDEGYLVAWQEGTAGKAVLVKKLDAQGKPVGTALTLGMTDSPEARPVLSRAPNGYAVAWMDKAVGLSAVQVATFDASLKVNGPKRIVQNAGHPWISGDDQALGLVWSDKRSGVFQTRFGSVAPELTLAQDNLLRNGNLLGYALLPRMLKIGDGYFTAWEDWVNKGDNQIVFAAVGPDGKKLADGWAHEPGTGDANWPNMTYDGKGIALVFYQWRKKNPHIYASYLEPGTGERLGTKYDLQVSSTPMGSMARYPDIQWNGADFAVMWIDTRSKKTTELYFRRVACSDKPRG
jgi:hypothetical protein